MQPTPVLGWERRDCFDTLSRFLKAPHGDRVCLLYGLRRTFIGTKSQKIQTSGF